MIKSMTGFGRASLEKDGRSFTVEIKSVNHRYCDLSIKMPKTLLSLEDRIRKVVLEKVNRGKVDVFITLNTYDRKDVAAVFNQSLADSYVECLNNIRGRYNLKEEVSLSLIARFPEVVTLKQEQDDVEELWKILICPLKESVELLVQMREREGVKLQQNILSKCDYIKSIADSLEEKAPMVVKEYEKKLNERLGELIQDYKIIDENRVAMEIALFADKASIDEELVRLNSHIIQVKEAFKLEEPVGRKLDFIVQEMNRETNTIGSKANNLEIVNYVISIKNENEKIREQIQNIE
jgi:uncharacterized protein (TIGR00255 family)